MLTSLTGASWPVCGLGTNPVQVVRRAAASDRIVFARVSRTSELLAANPVLPGNAGREGRAQNPSQAGKVENEACVGKKKCGPGPATPGPR
jgi:hypothetical protein